MSSSSPPAQKTSLYVPALLMVAALLYLPWLGSYGPLDPTDSFFIEAAREAVETKQYLLPMINYEYWLDKPILYFWAVSGSFHLLGINAFAGRIFTALTAMALGLVVYFGSRGFIGKRQAFLAALIFYAFPLSSALGHVSLTDMPLTLFMSGGLYGLFHYHHKKNQKALWLGYFSLAMAFLCKGPIAIILVGAILCLHLAATSASAGAFFSSFLNLRPLAGFLVILGLNLPWYAAATIGTKGAFFKDFFITQNFGRMVGTVNHQQPFWFYIPVFIGGLFPFNLLLLSAPALKLRHLRQRLSLNEGTAFMLFQAIWAIFVLVLFSIIKTKLPTYILPAMAPLAVLCARAAALTIRLGRAKRLLPAALITLVTAVGAAVAAYKVTGWARLLLMQSLPLLVLIGALSLAQLWFILRGKTQKALLCLLTLGVISVGIAVPQAHIAFYEDRQVPVDALTLKVLGQGGSLATIIRSEPSFSYWLHKHIPCVKTPAEARSFLSTAQGPHWVLAPKEVLNNIEWFGSADKIEVAGKTKKWTLFKIKP
ncbi:MAG TPA: glycosyltransferase family 39 protein [Candidatus Obscuribacter sp.]|nr:glycosyltransferase family 39 protein [Candidatus Obscuribacter sp.]MBL8085950.1 glycosyltransferase family 39 protein [Candidatus Obscuribacter sp.]HND69340.1 glycosyltransferase family 39 protein [Candidatus Obscuribacter sp.]HNM50476.1 glycosyltransferase family 39 protein [Candidatus Obscuribacter sp.]